MIVLTLLSLSVRDRAGFVHGVINRMKLLYHVHNILQRVTIFEISYLEMSYNIL